MQIVIDIPDDEYEIIKACTAPMTWVEHLIKNGIPLPKGHGRLIDENNLIKEIEDDIVGNYFDMRDWIRDSKTIIEADGGQRE